RKPGRVEGALAYAIHGPLRPNEILVPPSRMATATELQDRVFRWMTASYDSIARRIPPNNLSELAEFADGCSLERLTAAKKFFATPGHAPAGIKEELGRVSDAVHDCAALHAREVEAVTRALRQAESARPATTLRTRDERGATDGP